MANEQPSAPTPSVNVTIAQEFRNFLRQYGIVGLAIAVVIGGKLNALVTSLVNDLFMPVVLQPALKAARVDDIRELQFGGIFYGKVIGATIDFLAVAFVVFIFAKFVIRDEELIKKK
jgi:large conductance mechanosensitive channel